MSSSSTSSPAARRTAAASSSSPAQHAEVKTRSPTPNTASGSTASGAARRGALNKTTGTPGSAKAAVRRPGSVSTVASGSAASSKDAEKAAADEDARAATTALIDDLKAQLFKAETASEEYEKQLHVLQSRLDEALTEQEKLEERANAHAERAETLEMERQEAQRQKKDLESHIEGDREANTREREEFALREEELNNIIKRLKESIAHREPRKSVDSPISLSRTQSFRGRSSPTTENSNVLDSPLSKRDSSQGSKLILQKDKVIEELRLELAEAQIRLVEMENAGGGRLQELEKTLLETRMANAKLMEDNESYQYLLSEKTLNGDLTRGGGVFRTGESKNNTLGRSPGPEAKSSLAAELEVASENPEVSSETNRNLETEISTLRNQNQALTLYINNIITKMLQSDKFEALFESGTITGENNPLAGRPQPFPNLANKELPKPPPTEEDDAVMPSLLQRAGSLFGARARPRPRSTIIPNSAVGNENENPATPFSAISPGDNHLKPLPKPIEHPETAPSVPIKLGDRAHGHRRSKSEWSANIAANSNMNPSSMYRSPPGGSPSNRPSTPEMLGLGSPRTRPVSMMPPTTQPILMEDATELEYARTVDSRASGETAVHRAPSDSAGSRPTSDDLSTSPRSATAMSVSTDGRSSANVSVGTGGTVFSSSSGGMRPLRLVQEKDKADEAAAAAERERKKANRSSFMGWFQRPATASATSPPQTSNPSAPPPLAGAPRPSTDA